VSVLQQQSKATMVGLSRYSVLIGFDLARSASYEPNEIKYTVLATDKHHDTLEAACHDIGDYVEQNIGTDVRHALVGNCLAGTHAVEDVGKSAWFGPDWKKSDQAAVEKAIVNNKWFACSGGEADVCFDGYEQVRFTDRQKVCETLLAGHESDAHRIRMYPKEEALQDCQRATEQPGVKFTKKFERDSHLLPLQSFCKMDTLDEICENAWYDDDSEVWKLRTSCECQKEHTVECPYGESIQDCMTRMFANLGMVSSEFERIEFVVAETDSVTPHTKKINSIEDLYTQMTTAVSNKETKWRKSGKLSSGADVFE